MSYVRYTRHTSPTPPHYLATRLLLLDCCTRRFRPYTAPIQWPDGSARPPNCPPRLLCIVPASTAPPGVSRRLSIEEVPATPAMALMVMVVHLLQRGVLRRFEIEFCAVRSAHASREVLDRSLSCGRSVDAIGTLQRLMSTASVLEHRAHQRRQMKLVGAHQPRSRSVPGDRTRDAIFSHPVGGGRGGLARRSAGGGRRWRLCMPETLPLPTLRACVASSKSLVGDDEAAAAAGLDGGEVLEVVRDAML